MNHNTISEFAKNFGSGLRCVQIQSTETSADVFEIINLSKFQFTIREDVITDDIEGLSLSQIKTFIEKDEGIKVSEKELNDTLNELYESLGDKSHN